MQIQFPNSAGIYQIINLVNGKIYVGSSNNLYNRKKSHLSCLRNNRHENPHLQSAWDKYKERNFDFEILQIVKDYKSIVGCEQFWLNSTCCTDRRYGYNIASNAQHPSLGLKKTEKTKKKLSESLKRVFAENPEIGLKMSKNRMGSKNGMYGKKHSKETILKFSKKRLGMKASDLAKKNMSIIKRGELNCNAKLNSIQVKIIRHLCKFKTITQKPIAEFFNVSLGTIECIRARKTWKYI